MSFEEQFPSLYNNGYEYDTDLVNVSEIKKFCLDKQKVREAIEKAENLAFNDCSKDENTTEADGIYEFKRNLLKELGL